jgi:Asp-tRNA(Asn)/Glu-tRNA(Gln) amidotransferase A subunit family amidase
MESKIVYLSGRITGIESEANILFNKAEKELSSNGYIVVNPMRIEHNHDKSWESYMRACIKSLCDCSAIYMLSNWQKSRGAKIEWELASTLGLQILFEDYSTKELEFDNNTFY